MGTTGLASGSVLPTVSLASQARPGNPDGVGPSTREKSGLPVRSPPENLLDALVERELYYFERLCLAAEVDVQGGAWCGVFDVDVGQGDRVTEGRTRLA